jgi:hypothetical protein
VSRSRDRRQVAAEIVAGSQCESDFATATYEPFLTVEVEDARIGDGFQLAVAPERALDAFYHPFAYAA